MAMVLLPIVILMKMIIETGIVRVIPIDGHTCPYVLHGVVPQICIGSGCSTFYYK